MLKFEADYTVRNETEVRTLAYPVHELDAYLVAADIRIALHVFGEVSARRRITILAIREV